MMSNLNYSICVEKPVTPMVTVDYRGNAFTDASPEIHLQSVCQEE